MYEYLRMHYLTAWYVQVTVTFRSRAPELKMYHKWKQVTAVFTPVKILQTFYQTQAIKPNYPLGNNFTAFQEQQCDYWQYFNDFTCGVASVSSAWSQGKHCNIHEIIAIFIYVIQTRTDTGTVACSRREDIKSGKWQFGLINFCVLFFYLSWWSTA